MKLPLKAHL